MTTEELGELFLVHLYDLAEAAPHPNFFFTMNDFASTMGISDREGLQKALDFLGDRGLVISAVMDMWGGISAAITMEGSVFVEAGGETGIIGRYRQDPQAFRIGLPAEPCPAPAPPKEAAAGSGGTEGVRPRMHAVEAILADMEEVLEKDATTAFEVRRDGLADLATLKIQMGRSVRNRQVIEAVLDNLGAVPPIAPLVAGLRCIIGAYLE